MLSGPGPSRRHRRHPQPLGRRNLDPGALGHQLGAIADGTVLLSRITPSLRLGPTFTIRYSRQIYDSIIRIRLHLSLGALAPA